MCRDKEIAIVCEHTYETKTTADTHIQWVAKVLVVVLYLERQLHNRVCITNYLSIILDELSLKISTYFDAAYYTMDVGHADPVV